MKLELIEKARYEYNASVVYEIIRTMTAASPKDSKPETVIMGTVMLSVDSGLNTNVIIEAKEPFVLPLIVRTDVRSLKTNYESDFAIKTRKANRRKTSDGK